MSEVPDFVPVFIPMPDTPASSVEEALDRLFNQITFLMDQPPGPEQLDDDLERRAGHARKAYYTRLAMASARARRK